jgi:sugar phosphate isomerase/epimerase
MLAVVAEPFVRLPLDDLLGLLDERAPAVRGLELGSGGYAPAPHLDRELLLADEEARRRYLEHLEERGFRLAALNAWGNPLHPEREVARRHDADLRETIRLAAELGVDRVVAMAGCPAADDTGRVPHFAAGGWLPYLEGIHELQWERDGAPYWSDLAAFARAEHPDLLVCIELHPGTLVYNVDTFRELAALGDNLAANLDPSHFFWMQMDALAVARELAPRIGHVHAKDVVFDERRLALQGLLDHRWPDSAPWRFATVGAGHDAAWWSDLLAELADAPVRAVAIEHEDPTVPPEDGVPAAAGLLAPLCAEAVR